MSNLFFPILLIFIGLTLGFSLSFIIAYLRKSNASNKIYIMLEDAKKEAENMKKDAIKEQREESYKIKSELDKEIKEKKAELKESEERLLQREANMDKRDELYQKRESSLDEKEERLTDRFNEIQYEKSKVDELKNEQLKLLEKISGFTEKEAKDYLMNDLRSSMDLEMANYIKDREQSAKMQADKVAKEMVLSSMQRYAADIASDQTVTVVDLPNDDMKGRIIGREGRNIRTIEAVTGVDLIIDDTPEAVVLSSFDPLRREIARVMLETLIKDGRIHPTRIEEIYDKVCKDMKQKTLDYGNDALFELGITQMASELVELVGKLHFRTSYGQNALQHSIEVSQLSGVLAAEFGEDVSLAKRAGLLHDIGKAIDHDVEGSHVELGVRIATKFLEDDVVINSIASHHGDCEASSIIASIVAIADSLSASRPGARNDSLENYIKRLTQLEEVGNQITGVEKAYAVQAGRELRVVVKPEEVDDIGALKIAREVKEKVESTMKYPGTIKITVVREVRAQEEAK
ncbi:MAG: ribonuclease Y [Bacilli bacterium]|nr:ribonuclease Y [Bacilli bacterium]